MYPMHAKGFLSILLQLCHTMLYLIYMRGERMNYTVNELTEAKRQIDSLLHKLRETIKTLESKENSERYKSQITLAKRRVEALDIANVLIIRELSDKESEDV